MANSLIAKIKMTDKAYKIFVLVGNIHTIKANVEWLVDGYDYLHLRELLDDKMPSLKLFSIISDRPLAPKSSSTAFSVSAYSCSIFVTFPISLLSFNSPTYFMPSEDVRVPCPFILLSFHSPT